MDSQAWDARFGGDDYTFSTDPNVFLVREVSGLAPGRALDVACGEGRNAAWLAAQGWTVTAVDFSPVGLGKARRLAAARGVEVDFVLADLLDYEPAPGAFDLVAVLYLHLPADRRRTVLERAAGALAPGGTLLVVGHDTTNVAEGYGGPQDPAVLFSAEDVTAELPGLRVEKATREHRHVATPEGERTAIDALVRAVRPA